jgi:thiosulfate/3-mercaptopyruvate sulfurtransferase
MRTAAAFALALLPLLHAAPAAAGDVFITHEEAAALLGKPEVRFVWADSEKEYSKAHLPGSVVAYAHDLHYLDDVKACQGLPMCEPHAAAFIGAELGVDAATEVVVYDLGAGANASGTWFFLKLYGVKKVRILEGGLATWKAHGGAVEAGQPPKVAARTFVPVVDRTMIATVDEVKKATADGSKFLILDARHNLDEYAGNKDGQADKPTLKDPAELQKQLEKLKKNGYDPAKTVISYCHVGLGRGSFQYLALKQAGHADVKVYVGSWDEWGNDPSLPLAAQP